MISELMEKMFIYLMDRGFTQEKLQDGTTSPFTLSMMIAKYAHRDQKRENGEEIIKVVFERPTEHGFDTLILNYLAIK